MVDRFAAAAGLAQHVAVGPMRIGEPGGTVAQLVAAQHRLGQRALRFLLRALVELQPAQPVPPVRARRRALDGFLVALDGLRELAQLLIAAGYRSPVPWQVDPLARGAACSVARQEPAADAAVQPGATARLFLVGGKDCSAKKDKD